MHRIEELQDKLFYWSLKFKFVKFLCDRKFLKWFSPDDRLIWIFLKTYKKQEMLMTHFAWIIHRKTFECMNWRCHIHKVDNFLHYLNMYINKNNIKLSCQLLSNCSEISIFIERRYFHTCKYLKENCLQTTSFRYWWQCSIGILLFPREWLPFIQFRNSQRTHELRIKWWCGCIFIGNFHFIDDSMQLRLL